MPGTYDKLGITFQYPDNWTLDESDAVEGDESVTVYSPGGAFWTVTVHPRHRKPVDLAKAALAAMAQEYEGLESEPVEEQLAGRELTGFDLNFFYLDLTNTAWIRGFRSDEATYLIFCQAEDRELKQAGPVFRAMTVSLLRGRG